MHSSAMLYETAIAAEIFAPPDPDLHQRAGSTMPPQHP
jgi:hypothetical protein